MFNLNILNTIKDINDMEGVGMREKRLQRAGPDGIVQALSPDGRPRRPAITPLRPSKNLAILLDKFEQNQYIR